jgi:hypothetical protein
MRVNHGKNEEKLLPITDFSVIFVLSVRFRSFTPQTPIWQDLHGSKQWIQILVHSSNEFCLSWISQDYVVHFIGLVLLYPP